MHHGVVNKGIRNDVYEVSVLAKVPVHETLTLKRISSEDVDVY